MKPNSTPEADQARIRVLVADDHPVVRHGIIANVNPQADMIVVAEAADGVEALALIKEHLPDVVILDLRMPQMDGLDVISEANTSKLSSKFIIMTTFESEEDVHRAIKAGARGYLLKDSSQEEILDAIRRVNLGESYLPARIVQKVAESPRKPELSPREMEVLQCLAAGKSNKEIGAQLFIAEGTVKTHIKIFWKNCLLPVVQGRLEKPCTEASSGLCVAKRCWSSDDRSFSFVMNNSLATKRWAEFNLTWTSPSCG